MSDFFSNTATTTAAAAASTADDPILTPNPNVYTLFPVHDQDVWKMYKKHMDSFWRCEEVDLSKDLADWNDKLSDDERYFLSMIIAFFAGSDGIVLENLGLRFMRDVQLPEIKAFYGFQIMMENVHSEMYSLLIETYIHDRQEKQKLFDAIHHFPCIGKKAAWAQRRIHDQDSSFAKRLVAFACVEGLFFSASFASIYWIKNRGLLPGLTFSNELISRDESIHTEFAIMLYHKLPDTESLDPVVIRAIIAEAVEIEKEFAVDALPCSLIGMNAARMKQYVEFVADRLSLQLGCAAIFGAQNPFPFMELISIESKVNFFERTNSEYSLSNKAAKTECDFEFSGGGEDF